MKTYRPKNSNIKRESHTLDASKQPLGRLAVEASRFLIGKHRIDYVPNYDLGDNVKIINADKLVLTGKKMQDKKYYHHSWYPGGLTTKTAEEKLKENSEYLIERAIYGMLPKNRLRADRLKRLKIEK